MLKFIVSLQIVAPSFHCSPLGLATEQAINGYENVYDYDIDFMQLTSSEAWAVWQE
jgi:hypothetical protein